MACQCKICQQIAETKRLLEGASPELTAHVWKLWDRIEAAEMDAAVYRAKLDGTWPVAAPSSGERREQT